MTERRRQIAIAYGLLSVGLLVIFGFVLEPALGARAEFRREMAVLVDTRSRAEAAIARAGRSRQQVDEALARVDLNALTLAGETASLAAAELQSATRRIIEAHDGVLSSTGFREAQVAESLASVTVEVRVNCSTEALAAILHALESRPETLFIEDLSIESRQRSNRDRANRPEMLDVRFEVTGFGRFTVEEGA